MSLINQVLNDLKKRGSAVSGTKALIRPVAAQPRWKRNAGLAAAAVALTGAVAGALWYSLDLPLPESMQLTANQQAPRPAPHPASAAPRTILAASQPAAAASQSVATVQVPSAVAASGVQEAHESEVLPLRLSLELASQPVPAPPVSKHADAKEKGLAPGHKQAAHKPAKKAPLHPPMVAGAAEREDSSIKRMSPQQQAEGEFNQAADLIQQGRGDEARRHLENALHLNPSHVQARLVLASLLLGSKRGAEAESVLQEGLRNDPTQARLSMLLARLQVERGALAQAQETLQKTLPYANGQAEYQAFLAAVLQRQNLHEEAVLHYQAALRLSPGTGAWWMGMGISLQALKRNDEARDAFKHAIDSGTLSAELQDFVKRKIKEL